MSAILQSIQRLQERERAMERHRAQFAGPPCPPRFVVPASAASVPDAAEWLEQMRSAGYLLPVVVDRLGGTT